MIGNLSTQHQFRLISEEDCKTVWKKGREVLCRMDNTIFPVYQCYEAAMYLRTKVLDKGMYWGRNSKGRGPGDQEERQERRLKKL